MPTIEKECQTQFGRFKVKIDDENINVGGKTFCVNIALYKTETCLYWLKTDNSAQEQSLDPHFMWDDEGGCELNEKEIRGDNTIKMTDLAFSLLRKYYPERTGDVTLLDDSGFTWYSFAESSAAGKDRRGRKYKTNFLKGYLLLHRKTWYEDKFKAVMCDPTIYSAYRLKAEKNFDDPTKKPETFDFVNSEVKEKLDPLYKSSKTWGEFIQKIKDNYNDEKYKLIYDWYRQAIYIIFDGIEINQNWKIDISKRPYIECESQNGGKRTRKRRKITFSKYNRLEPFSWSPIEDKNYGIKWGNKTDNLYIEAPSPCVPVTPFQYEIGVTQFPYEIGV